MVTGVGVFAFTAPPMYTCDAVQFLDTAKAGVTAGTSDADKKNNCCTNLATCSGYSCSAGYKLKSNPGNFYCASDTCATGDASTCCELDTTKCGGITGLTCDTGKYWDSAKAGNTAGTTDTEKKTNCCTTKAMCSTYTCAAGYTSITAASTTTCSSDAASCTSSACCTADTTKCGGITALTCDADKYWDPNKAGTSIANAADDAEKKDLCCTTKATCAWTPYDPSVDKTIYCREDADENAVDFCKDAD